MAKRPSKGKSVSTGSEGKSSKKATTPRKRAAPTSSSGITGVQASAQAGGGGTFLNLSGTGAAMTAVVADLSVVQDDFTVVAHGGTSDPRAEVLQRLAEIMRVVGDVKPIVPKFDEEIADKLQTGTLGNQHVPLNDLRSRKLYYIGKRKRISQTFTTSRPLMSF